jgi:hypothetical protein
MCVERGRAYYNMLQNMYVPRRVPKQSATPTNSSLKWADVLHANDDDADAGRLIVQPATAIWRDEKLSSIANGMNKNTAHFKN